MATKLFVGGLSYELTEEKLTELFSAHGDVESAIIIKDRETGRSKGFGFVEMSGDGATKAIAALNSKEVEGRKLTVNEARPKEDKRY